MIQYKMLGFSMSMLLISSIITVNSQCPNMQNSLEPSVDEQLRAAKLDFSLDSLYETSQLESESDIFFSPYSIYDALYLAFLGAQNHTEENLRKALKIPENLTKTDLLTNFNQNKMIKQLALIDNKDKGYEFTAANRLYISSAKKIKDCMENLLSGDLEKIDFSENPDAARNNINEWVSKSTEGHIKDLIPSDGIDSSTDIVLVNAVYFKGVWQSQFNANSTQRGLFYGKNGQSSIFYMKQKATFHYDPSEILGAHVLELPYKGENASMFIFLPPLTNTATPNNNTTSNHTDRVNTLIHVMTKTEDGLAEVREILAGSMPAIEVDVSIPKFTMEKELPMGQLLEKMGADDLVRANQANLRGFLDDEKEDLHLGDAVHKAKIDLNEEGTTAAGATAIFSFRSSRPSGPAIFKADHPFVYLIYDRGDQSILFFGIYRAPASDIKNPNN